MKNVEEMLDHDRSLIEETFSFENPIHLFSQGRDAYPGDIGWRINSASEGFFTWWGASPVRFIRGT
jgi:hypothetical protein